MQPNSHAEYLERFHRNNRVEGFGMDVKCVVPCPFCAAADWMAWPILQVEEKMQEGATCQECKRSARAIFTYADGGKSFEIVQTGGPDQPEWLQPKMRRVEEAKQ